MTPRYGVLPIVKYLPKDKIIWCPFDKEDSEFVKVLTEQGYKVVYSHIEKRNTPSVELHLKCGFQFYRDYAKYLDGTVTHNSCTMYILLKKQRCEGTSIFYTYLQDIQLPADTLQCLDP